MTARSFVVAVSLLALPACSGSEEAAPQLVFGEVDGACGVTVLSNDIGDEELLRAGVDCLIERFDDGDTVTWDLLVPTVEGDPILYRFESEGAQITIIEDATRDSFGSGAVVAQTCDQIDDTGFIPSGSDCTDSRGQPFDLPGDLWPP